MEVLVPRYNYVKCFGLWGTYIDAMKWRHSLYGPLCILSLGSFFGNDHFEKAAALLNSWRVVMRKDDLMLLGLDGRQDPTHLWKSYHSSDGLFEDFLRNGLENSNHVLGCKWYYADDWVINGILQENPIMHRFQTKALRPVICEELGLHFDEGDSMDCFEVFKYDPSTMMRQF